MDLYNDYINLIGISPNEDFFGFLFTSLLLFWLFYNILAIFYSIMRGK